MSTILRCGLTQAKNDVVPPSNGTDKKTIDKIRDAMLEKHLQFIKQAADQNVQILCFQELFNGPYFCAEQNPCWYEMAEEIPDGPTVKKMQELAKKHKMVLIVPMYEKEQTGVYYNTAAVIDA